jgi:uncharacterized membrane protein
MEWFLGITLLLLFVFGYPFLAASIMGGGAKRRIGELEGELAQFRKLDATGGSAPRAPPAQPAQPAPISRAAAQPEPAPAAQIAAAAPRAPDIATTPAFPHAAPAAPPRTPPPGPQPASAPQAAPYAPRQQPRWLLAARNWLLTGNLVAKLGLVILFIGVAFLLKYVAETVVIPIELRLAGVVLADLGLLAWGWRLRTSRRDIGLPVQGTAIAVLMLVVFGAFQRYGLIPGGFAFAMLVVLTVFACVLALLQNAVWLAVFGITGGFACPLLVATGQGNHIGLFSYYALLNAGVFAIAMRRTWRSLNLLGFGFTFVVGAAWGGLKYAPENYLSAQAFLILFFLFYVGVALAFARQQQTRLKDYVDATLVLGNPLLAFGLQVGMVRDKPFGLALSALALGGFYLGLGLLLWRRGGARWRVLVETFGAMGAVLGTLAIPFAIDGRWTSGAWALEGVGFVWYGLRRGQPRAWMFGLALQVGAWIGFLGAVSGIDRDAAASNLWLGFLLLAGSAFAMANRFRKHADALPSLFGWLPGLLLTVAAVWLLAGSWVEAIVRTDGSVLADLLAVSALMTAAVLYFVGVRLVWPVARTLWLAAQVAAAAGLTWAASGIGWNPFDMLERTNVLPGLGAVLIAVSALVSSRLIERMPAPRDAWPAAVPLLAWAGFWWFGPVINIFAGRLAEHLPGFLGTMYTRWVGVYALAVALSAALCMQLAPRLHWDRLRWLSVSCWAMLGLVTVASLALLYVDHTSLYPANWLAWAFLWAGSEYLLVRWPASAWEGRGPHLRILHALRTAGPWLALWPAGVIATGAWLGERDGMAEDVDWVVGSAWSTYLPTWAMMAVLAWLLGRSSAGAWPTRPLSGWYRRVVLPGAVGLLLALCAVWNLTQDGGMAPLPYLPLLNPLDLTTGFALLLAVAAAPVMRRALLTAGAIYAYAWFNLILLRSTAHYLGIGYRAEVLAGTQFVQAMLSLVWSASALVVMRFAAQHVWRRAWSAGAVLLGVVVAKLFLVDLSSHGSMARVVSFVGVGLLMLLVGYLAPFPKTADLPAPPEPTT